MEKLIATYMEVRLVLQMALCCTNHCRRRCFQLSSWHAGLRPPAVNAVGPSCSLLYTHAASPSSPERPA